jgi:hypothetical protein
VTATQGEGFADLDDTDERSFLVIAPRDPEMQMYVRNLSEEPGRNPASDAGDSETYPEDGGSAYFKTDLVNTNPGDTLEYLVTITAGNEGPLNAGPYQRPETPFLEYVAGTTALNAASLADNEITAGEGVTLKHEGAEGDTIDTNETAYVTYRMTVIGGVGDKPAIAATYTGCLIEDAEDRQKWCQPDGTLWADAPVLMRALVDHTACWRDITEDEGEWVVGANGFHENHQYQPIIREAATSKESQGYEDDNRYACQMKGMANYLIECFTDKRLTRRDCR